MKKTAFHIVQWNVVNETSESRKFKNLSWYAKSNKLVGMGISRLRSQENRVELFGVWGMIEILASSAPRDWRGWLVRNGQPLSTEDMAFLTSFPKEAFDRAVTFFKQPEIGWLEELTFNADSPGIPVDTGRSTEGCGRLPADSPGIPGDTGRSTEGCGRKSATDRQTDRQLQTDIGKNNKGALPGNPNPTASRTQFAAASARVKELEGKGASVTVEERQELRKKRALVTELQKKQAAGDFNPIFSDQPKT